MSDFLLELRSEEIPARMQTRAREDLVRLFGAELAKAGIAADAIVTYATPRRLALIARGLPQATDAVREETKGPKTSAPPQALDGFLRKTGLTREQLEERDGVFFAVTERPGRATAEVLAAAIPAIVRTFPWPKSMRWGEASVSTESPRWVRPLQGIVALFGQDVVDCEVAGVTSGAATVGHRFHHPDSITIGSADDYVEKLRACHVIVDQNERAAIIAVGAKLAAQGEGLALVEDEGLLAENAGLTEWPVPLIGRFEPAFLDVPPEVIQLTARVNQKYFVCRDAGGKLANAFVCTANVDAADGGDRIVAGNAKVLAARLSDAKFFYDTDLKVRLEELTPKLEKIVFHERLGTVADKVERVAMLARWLVEQGVVGGKRADAAAALPVDPTASPVDAGRIADASTDTGALADMAERAARLAKADLVTGMVGEFPELQGVMGGYYAAAQGEPVEVADAVRDHYKPVGQGDDVPTAPVTVALSLADKLDTLISFFIEDEKPTGSKDPFALRRAAIAIIGLIITNNIRVSLVKMFEPTVVWRDVALSKKYHYVDPGLQTIAELTVRSVSDALNTIERMRPDTSILFEKRGRSAFPGLVDFFADRLKVQQREAGVRHDLIDAVFALGGEDDLVRLLARVKALQAFVGTEDGANLLAGYKRAANILKKEGWVDGAGPRNQQSDRASQGAAQTGEEDPLAEVSQGEDWHAIAAGAREEGTAYAPEAEEVALMTALGLARPRAEEAIEREDFEGAMAALATLRAPIDAFFDKVTVNDANPAKRAHRLTLLSNVRDAVHRVADFAKIEG